MDDTTPVISIISLLLQNQNKPKTLGLEVTLFRKLQGLLPVPLTGSIHYQDKFPCTSGKRVCFQVFLGNLQLSALRPGKQTLLLAAVDYNWPLSKARRGCGIRLLRWEHRSYGSITKTERSGSAQGLLHSKHFPYCCVRRSNNSRLTYTLPVLSAQTPSAHLLSSLFLSFLRAGLPGDRSLAAAPGFYILESADMVPRSVDPRPSTPGAFNDLLELWGPSLGWNCVLTAQCVCQQVFSKAKICLLQKRRARSTVAMVETNMFCYLISFNGSNDHLGCPPSPHTHTVSLFSTFGIATVWTKNI